MKVVFELDTDKADDKTTLARMQKAEDCVNALHDLADAIREWYKYPEDNEPLTPDSLRENFYKIMGEYMINLDTL